MLIIFKFRGISRFIVVDTGAHKYCNIWSLTRIYRLPIYSLAHSFIHSFNHQFVSHFNNYFHFWRLGTGTMQRTINQCPDWESAKYRNRYEIIPGRQHSTKDNRITQSKEKILTVFRIHIDFMRIRIQLWKCMRIHADPSPGHKLKTKGTLNHFYPNYRYIAFSNFLA
jgi:hypothetical protein